MPEFLEDTGQGWRVRTDDGREVLMTPDAAMANGIAPPQQPVAPAAAVPPAPAYEPLQMGGGRFSYEPEQPPMEVEERPPMPMSPADMRPGQSPGVGVQPAMQKPAPAEPEAEEPGVDPSSLVFAREQAPQQPQGPQFATLTQTNTSTSKRLGVDEDLALMDDAAERQAGAIRDQAEAQESFSTKVAALRDMEAEAREKTATQVAARRAETEAKVDERMGEIQTLQQDFEQAAEEGKGSYWSRQETPTKIAAAIAVMFGALSEAYGGKNTGLEIINQTIDRDRQARRDAQADRQQAIRGKFDLMSAVRTVANDDTEADLMALDMQLGKIQSQIQQAADERGTEEAQAVAEQSIAALDQQRAQAQAQLRPQVTQNVMRKQVPIQGANSEDERDAFMGGQLRPDLSKGDVSKARGIASSANTMVQGLRRAKQILEEHGGWSAMDLDARNEYATNIALARGQMAKSAGMGSVMSEAESARMDKRLPPEMPRTALHKINPLDNPVEDIEGAIKAAELTARSALQPYVRMPSQQAPSSFRPGAR